MHHCLRYVHQWISIFIGKLPNSLEPIGAIYKTETWFNSTIWMFKDVVEDGGQVDILIVTPATHLTSKQEEIANVPGTTIDDILNRVVSL